MIKFAFKLNTSKIRVKVSKAAKDKVAYLTQYIVNYCIDNSPVDSGAFRAAWMVSEGTPYFNRIGRQPPGSVLPAPSFNVQCISDFPIMYVTNGQPYASKLENGYSKQAPYGIAWRAVASARTLK